MFEIICDMIELAAESKDYEMTDKISDLISEFARTINCPYDWRSIGERLADKYRENADIYNNFKLCDFDIMVLPF